MRGVGRRGECAGTYPTVNQGVHHSLHDLRLPQQALLHRHHAQFPTRQRFASLDAACRRLRRGILAAFVTASAALLQLLVNSGRVAHVAVVLGLDANRVLLEVAVRPYPGIEVLCVILEVLGRLVPCKSLMRSPV